MSRPARIVAALLLAILLPMQGWAAACAQICARVAEERHESMIAAVVDQADDEAAMHEHCGKSELGAGKCCQAHVFVADLPVSSTIPSLPSLERTFFVARWTNFIPEEPSPPPIPTGTVA